MNKGTLYPLPDKFKYSTVFATKIQPIVSYDKDKYLSVASLENLRNFIPNIDSQKIDLLPFACNAFLANRLNSNDDGVGTKEALALADLFPFSFLDTEHNRNHICGVILNASFSEFGTDKLLTKDEVKDYTKPFNVTLGGVIWRVLNPNLAEAVEESNDPSSEYYLKISASWEVAYNQYNLILLDNNQKNFEDGKIVNEASEIAKLEKKLKSFGGTGKTEDGKRIGRVLIGEVLPLGLGLTETPAADVKGIAVNIQEKSDNQEVTATKIINNLTEFDKTLRQNVENLINSSNLISQIQNPDVNHNSNKYMKLASLKDINDEVLKEVKASDLQELIDSEINKISNNFEKEKNQYKQDKDVLENKNKENTDKLSKATEDLQKVQEQLNKLVNAHEVKEKEEKFSVRMEAWDNGYDLDKEEKDAIANEIKELDDEKYDSWAKKMTVLLKSKKKQPKVDKEDGQVKASLETNKEVETVVTQALENGEKTATTVAATTTIQETLEDKMKKVFGIEFWSVNKKVKRI
jgi:hypothetical protein